MHTDTLARLECEIDIYRVGNAEWIVETAEKRSITNLVLQLTTL